MNTFRIRISESQPDNSQTELELTWEGDEVASAIPGIQDIGQMLGYIHSIYSQPPLRPKKPTGYDPKLRERLRFETKGE